MIFVSPEVIDLNLTGKNSIVFLAGSIEQGQAEEWQQKVVNQFEDNIIFLNPRRKQWDLTWVQSEDNPKFNEQVSWELDSIIEKSTIIFFYFQGNTKSPISLFELGICLGLKKELVIVCEEDFWRKGNIDITCKKFFGQKVFSTLEEGINELKVKLNVKEK